MAEIYALRCQERLAAHLWEVPKREIHQVNVSIWAVITPVVARDPRPIGFHLDLLPAGPPVSLEIDFKMLAIRMPRGALFHNPIICPPRVPAHRKFCVGQVFSNDPPQIFHRLARPHIGLIHHQHHPTLFPQPLHVIQVPRPPPLPDEVPEEVHVAHRILIFRTRSDVLGDLINLRRRLKPLDPLRVHHPDRRPRKRPVLGKFLRARPSARANLGADEVLSGRLPLEG
mmetsp:Transcript_18112/g.45778  ORF Transcript_18112/g.45778 Transcript_18112/m.45778 type:complete len:228 (-) Transcript_18112:383-1066(-)